METTRRSAGSPNFAVLRHEKIHHVTELTDVQRHNNREMDVPNAEPSAPEPVVVWGAANVRSAVTERIAALGITPREGAVIALELIMSTSREHWEAMPAEDRPRAMKRWIARCLAYARKRFGRHAMICAVLHEDETTPHLHVVVVPAVLKVDGRRRDGKERYSLTARDVVGGRGDMRQHQTVYARAMRRFRLVRGVEGSKARHIPNREYERILEEAVEAARMRELDALRASLATSAREEEADRRIASLTEREAEIVRREADLREREAVAAVTATERADHDARAVALADGEADLAARRQAAADWSADARKRNDALKAREAAVTQAESAITEDKAKVVQSMDGLTELRSSWLSARRALNYLAKHQNPEVSNAVRAITELDQTVDAIARDLPSFAVDFAAAHRRRVRGVGLY